MECWSGHRPVHIPGTIQLTLLATLLISEGKPVSADTLMFELWGESPPPKWETGSWREVQDWVRLNTPKDAIFVTPPRTRRRLDPHHARWT